MPSHRLPPAVERLLRERVTSFEEVEVLLLLRSAADRRWTVALVATELGMDAAGAAEAVEQLGSANLLHVTSDAGRSDLRLATFEYQASDPETEAAVASLERTKRRQPAALARQLAVNAVKRMRTAARNFATVLMHRRNRE